MCSPDCDMTCDDCKRAGITIITAADIAMLDRVMSYPRCDDIDYSEFYADEDA